VSDLWTPPSSRGAEEVTPGVEVTPIQGEPIPGPDDGIFLPAKGWGEIEAEDKRMVPSIIVEYEPVRQAVLDGTVRCDLYGMLAGFAATDGIADLSHGGKYPLGYFRLTNPEFHVYFFTEDAPKGWLKRVQGAGFAMEFIDPATGAPDCFIASGKLGKFHKKPLILPPTRRGAKPGRNDPCSCGSGKKTKRCCGA
jgi:hypothetical protein